MYFNFVKIFFLNLRRHHIFLAIAVLAWVYLWLKAAIMPMAHDEIATFFYFVQPGRFLPFLSKWEANNHILNSALTTLFYQLFGAGYLALRLANLLFFPLFAWYVFRFSEEIKSPVIRWTFILGLLCAHHFIEFFSISRGYGMSMALMTGALWHLFRTLRCNETRDYFLGLLLISLSLAANLSLMNMAILTTGIYGYHMLLNFKTSQWNTNLLRSVLIAALGVIPVVFFALYSFAMKERGLLYYGTPEGFIKVSVDTIIYLLTGSRSLILRYYILGMFVLSSGIVIYFFRKDKKDIRLIHPGNFFFILLTANVLASILLQLLLHVNYPEDRVALYFYPLFVGAAVFLFDRITPWFSRYWKWVPIHLLAPFLLLPIHMLWGLNLKYTFNYKNDYMPEEFYLKVKDAHTPGELPATVGGYRTRHFAWSMHDFRHGGTESPIHFANYPSLLADYQVVNMEDHPEFLKYYDIMAREEVNGRCLLKRKQFLERVPQLIADSLSTGGEISGEFFNLYSGQADSLRGKSLYISANLTVASPAKPFSAWLVFNVRDEAKNDLRYEFIPLDWLRASWDGSPSNFMNGTLLHDLPETSDRLLVYLWNINKVPFSVEEGELRVNMLKTE